MQTGGEAYGHAPAQGQPPAQGHTHGGHGHGHGHGPAAPVSRHLRKVIAAVLVPFAVAVLAGLVVLWPGGTPGHHHDHSGVGFDRPTFGAKVTKLVEVDCGDVNVRQPPSGSGGGSAGQSGGGAQDGGGGAGGAAHGPCRKATVKVTEGKDAGRTFTEVVTPDATRTYEVGQKVVVGYSEKAPRALQYSVVDTNRDVPMVLLAGVFALVVVLVGRLRGVLALVGLVISFAVLTLFILPAILQGSNPLVVAVIGGSAIMLATLYLCHGLSARTSVAVLGTLVSLLLIGVLGSLFIDWAQLTGNTDDQTGLVHGLYPGIEVKGLLLAGVLIGSLGVLDDVTVTQTSAVWELREADPGASWHKIYRSAMRIGRDHIASVVNTLVLAYAGAALPLLLLFSIARSDVTMVATSEVVAEEIVRTLVGSIGLVASVPVTTLLAALVVSADRSRAASATVPASASASASADGYRGGGGAGHSAPGRAPSPGVPAPNRRGGRRRKPK
ncbi:YibE/F family protein [Streptomyces reniochalinae]|uniref:YibE/F family protein n=1 Tax=Streptomyces reniochalinae TaxID=2250578 RepID=A0A367EGG9_9ACTN|nr:YibE/F family protein [Streptomyces reniochalinae]RCG17063.1 YibE/F family protein [Streptomyces reniochalinae]